VIAKFYRIFIHGDCLIALARFRSFKMRSMWRGVRVWAYYDAGEAGSSARLARRVGSGAGRSVDCSVGELVPLI
jgi:hypothetical protein